MGGKNRLKSKRVERETVPLLWGGKAAGKFTGCQYSNSLTISPLCLEIKYGNLL